MTPKNGTKNIERVIEMYKLARERALMSAEEASFRIGIGISSLYRYESGAQQTPPDVVCGMAEAYRNPELAYMHCTQRCPLGMEYGCPAMIKEKTAPCGAA